MITPEGALVVINGLPYRIELSTDAVFVWIAGSWNKSEKTTIADLSEEMNRQQEKQLH